MTRMDSVRAATGSARESVQHAAEAVAPYAGTAKEQAVLAKEQAAVYAREARVRLAPTVSKAAQAARIQYGAHVAPRVPPKIDDAARLAADRTRKAARQAAEYTVPRVEQAVATAQPVAEEAAARSAAALAALRGQVTVREIQKLVRRHERRARAGRAVRGVVLVGALTGGAFAAWKWWDKQANPDWLVEPPAATEVPERAPLASVDGSHLVTPVDPEVHPKTEAERKRDENGHP
ncbi:MULTISPECIES: DUF5324 family protein [unclassified Streptomyces]|uniref:DUF5324 family protein n=1 Tax=unclassified Streptomyces TaxID=2593676 RepID=UPI00380A6FCF